MAHVIPDLEESSTAHLKDFTVFIIDHVLSNIYAHYPTIDTVAATPEL